jgi:hypothetical protein
LPPAVYGEREERARSFIQTKDERCRSAYVRGLDHILKAQYPTGGWPQRLIAEEYPQ